MITIYTGEDCIFCEKAIQLCIDKNMEYEDMPITEYVKAVIKFEHSIEPKTVPQIVRGEEYIGGYTDLVTWMEKS